jgi:hypothetical protein
MLMSERIRINDATAAGSANILKVIASSPTDVGPVLKAILIATCLLGVDVNADCHCQTFTSS